MDTAASLCFPVQEKATFRSKEITLEGDGDHIALGINGTSREILSGTLGGVKSKSVARGLYIKKREVKEEPYCGIRGGKPPRAVQARGIVLPFRPDLDDSLLTRATVDLPNLRARHTPRGNRLTLWVPAAISFAAVTEHAFHVVTVTYTPRAQ